QAEDGIRDFHVTGVQTCALPISNAALVGQQVRVVERGTTTPYPIYDGAGDPISGSLVTITQAVTTPTIWIDTETPETVYLDWYEIGRASCRERGESAAGAGALRK